MHARDDLGQPIARTEPARRVVSLVPSLTESIALTDSRCLVGATDWCTHPTDLDVPRIRGTKNPDIKAIIDLRPDLVLANKEENRRRDVERLRAAGIEVWVTVIESVPQALNSLRRMFTDGLSWDAPAWLDDADRAWRDPASRLGGHEPAEAATTPVRAAIAVWRDPWMVVGSATFTGDLAARVGLRNVYAEHAERYPRVELDEVIAARPELVVLPDEPYAFAEHDGPEAFPAIPTALVEGRLLTWYGPSLCNARERLRKSIEAQLAAQLA